MFTQLTEDNLDQFIKENEKVLVQFGSKSDPVLEQISAADETVKFIFVDVEKFPKSKRLALVKRTPTFAVFKNGKIVAQVESPKNDTLERLLKELN